MFCFLQIKDFSSDHNKSFVIDTLVYGTFMTENDISSFCNRVNCLNLPCTCIPSAILSHFVYILNEYLTIWF
jgi:hypothetical protein